MQDRYVFALMLAFLGLCAWFMLGWLFRTQDKDESLWEFVFNNVIVAAEAGVFFLAAAWVAELGWVYHSKWTVRFTALAIPPVVTAVRLLWRFRATIHLRLTSQ